jgi:DNA-binding GntR family transcriptional regulator
MSEGVTVFTVQRYQTKAELALQALRERIRSGDLAPGQKLLVDELSKDLMMSRTPIREALRTLAADGLVEHRPHLGTTVSERSPSEIDDAYGVRLLLEPRAAELAVLRMTPEDAETLERLHAIFVQSAMTAPGDTVQENNGQWHWALYRAAGSPALFESILKFWGLTPWRTSWVGSGRIEAIVEEHERVMDAVRRRDAEATAELLRAHLRASRQAALADDVRAGPKRVGVPN